MYLQTLVPVFVIILCIDTTLECLQKNISCNAMKTDKGFTFPHECIEAKEINVFDNKTKIARFMAGFPPRFSSEVVKMHNNSIVTRDCRGLLINCLVPNGEKYVKDVCVDYKVTEEDLDPDDSSQTKLLIPVFTCLGILLFGISCYFIFWKMKPFRATVSGLWENLKSKGCPVERGETPREGSVGQEQRAVDLDSTQLSVISETIEPRGSGEDGIEQEGTLRSVHVQSIDPPTDGETPHSSSLDHNLSNKGIQPTKNDLRVPGVNRSTRNDDKGDIVRNMNNGQPLGACGREDHGNEEQPLLSNERDACRGSDMTVDAGALVNKPGFDPDRERRCSTVPNTLVGTQT